MFFISVAGPVRVRQVSQESSSQSRSKGIILHRSQAPEGPLANALRIHRSLSQRISEILAHFDFSTPLQGHVVQSFSSNIITVTLLLLRSDVSVVVAL